MRKAVDRRSDIHRNGCGDAADSGIPAFSVVSLSSSNVLPRISSTALCALAAA